MLKGVILTLIVAALLWGGKTAYFGLTDGFSLSNINSNHLDDPDLAMNGLPIVEMNEIDKALNQDYFYLAKGNHSYVFESADHQYVIKFLQFQKYRHHFLISCLPLPEKFNAMRLKKTVHKEEKRTALLKSWKIAFTQLKEQTQLLFVRLNREEPFAKSLTVHNKCGIPYHLDLNRYVFMLQKKVDRMDDVLIKLVSNGDIQKAKSLLDDLLNLYVFEYTQGIYEEDRYIVRNTGVYSSRPMHLDVDRFRIDDQVKDPKNQNYHLKWKTTLLIKWLEEKYPELADYLKMRILDNELAFKEPA